MRSRLLRQRVKTLSLIFSYKQIWEDHFHDIPRVLFAFRCSDALERVSFRILRLGAHMFNPLRDPPDYVQLVYTRSGTSDRVSLHIQSVEESVKSLCRSFSLSASASGPDQLLNRVHEELREHFGPLRVGD